MRASSSRPDLVPRVFDATAFRRDTEALLRRARGGEPIDLLAELAAAQQTWHAARVPMADPSADPVAAGALRNVRTVEGRLRAAYGRVGWDGQGATVDIAVHAPFMNAAWGADYVMFGDGDGVSTLPAARSLDLVAHELLHGVQNSVLYRAPIPPADADEGREQLALREAWSDVLATAVDPDDWLIAEDSFVQAPRVTSRALRDLANPGIRHLDDASAAATSHELSGLASLAAVTASAVIGSDAVRTIWWEALRDHLRPAMGFAEAAAATIAAADARFGVGSREARAIERSWRDVGITSPDPGTSASRRRVGLASQRVP